jgi:hypothetical protein
MAITKTINIKLIQHTAATFTPHDPLDEPEMIWVHKEIIIDDPDDDQLPIRKTEVVRYKAGDDVSQEDSKVQAIFNAVFGQ